MVKKSFLPFQKKEMQSLNWGWRIRWGRIFCWVIHESTNIIRAGWTAVSLPMVCSMLYIYAVISLWFGSIRFVRIVETFKCSKLLIKPGNNKLSRPLLLFTHVLWFITWSNHCWSQRFMDVSKKSSWQLLKLTSSRSSFWHFAEKTIR